MGVQRTRVSLAACVLLALALGASASVLEVATVDGFEELRATADAMLVLFSKKSDCPRCDALLEAFGQLEMQQRAAGNRLVFVDVDIDAGEGPQLAQQERVKRTPTVRFYGLRGRPARTTELYEGEDTAAALQDWLEHRPLVVSDIVSPRALLNSLREDSWTLYGMFTNFSTPAAEAFLQAAKLVTAQKVPENFPKTGYATLGPVKFYWTTENISAVLHVPCNTSCIIAASRVGNQVRANAYTGDTNATTLALFAYAHRVPDVFVYHEDFDSPVHGPLRSCLILFASQKTQPSTIATFRRVAEMGRYKGKMLFVLINTDDLSSARRVARSVGYHWPSDAKTRPFELRITNATGKYTFKHVQERPDLSEAGMVLFIDAYLRSELKPHFLSAAQPADWDAEPVKVLTRNTFDQFVYDPDMHVLVFFYMPTCEHCLLAMPEVEDLADALEGVPNIRVAKLDVFANELYEVESVKVPLIVMFPAGKDKHLNARAYSGPSSARDYLQFIQAVTGVTLPHIEL